MSTIVRPVLIGPRRALQGIARFGAVVVATRMMSFCAQIVLGWILVPADFGAYAVALSATSLVFAFRELGISRLLAQRPAEAATLHHAAMRTAIAANGALALLAVILTWAGAGLLSGQTVKCVLLLAASLIVAAPATVYQARLAAAGEFRALARLSAASAMGRYAVMVVAALMGGAGVSFAYGALAAAICDTLFAWAGFLRMRVRTGERGGEFVSRSQTGINARSFARSIARPGFWVGVTTFAIALQTQGDNLIIGWASSAEELGIYFFSYQLTVAVSSLFTVGFYTVLLPTLSSAQSGAARQNAVEGALRTAAVFGPVAGVFAAYALPVLITAVWGARWASAARPAEILAVTVGARLLTPVAMAVYQAEGKWQAGAYISLADGFVIMVAAFVGAGLGDVGTIALSVGIARSVLAVSEALLAVRAVGLPVAQVGRRLVEPLVITAAIGVCFLVARNTLVAYGGPILHQGAIGLLLIISVGILHRVRYAATWRRVARSFRRTGVGGTTNPMEASVPE